MNERISGSIGPYLILGSVGVGAMGEIYRARDSRLDREVALKILNARLSQDPDAVDRFVREARAASALNHPNIVTIHETGECDGRRFIAMEFVKGQTLRELFSAGQLALTMVPHIGGQIARALGAAHAAGIVHRDIKPENIMVRDDGYVKVVDFGIARLLPTTLSTDETRARVTTNTQLFVGTPRYMSPEQARNEPVTSASDIFSFGVVLYEWATGRHPFASDSLIELLNGISSVSPLAPSRLNPEVSPGLEGMISEMLEKNPARRPTALDILGRLTAGSAVAPSVHAFGPARRHPGRPIVGRRREHAELRSAFDAVAAGGHGLLVCLAGEPGIGKTTLAEEVLGGLVSDGPPNYIGRGRCSERLAGTEAYLPWLEALDSLLRSEGGDSVARLAKTLAPAWYLQAAVTADPHGDRLDEVKAESQERLKRELLALLEEVSRHRPLVLFFDDLHWADASTVDLMAYIAARFDRLRLLIIATFRPTELQLAQHPFLALRLELQGRGLAREIGLDFLSPDDIDDYLGFEFPGHRFPPTLAPLIHGKTEGNPLFMVDLLRDLRDRGVIVRQDGSWCLAREVPDIERELPASIRSLIQRKVDALEDRDRHLLVVASVQGVRFDTAVIARALEISASTIEDRLDLLERVHGLVRLVGDEPLPDGTPSSQFQFVHVLYQNGLYGSLRPTRRAAVSKAVAQALVAFHTRDTVPIAAELAFLFEAARDFASAARYFLAAAQRAVEVFAYRETLALSRRGIEMVRKLPETAEQASIELELQLALGLSLSAISGYAAPEVEQAYARARTLCQHEHDAVRLFRVLEGPRRFYSVKPNLVAATELAEELLGLATSAGDDQLVAAAHANFSTPLTHRGDFAAGLAHTEQALKLWNPTQFRHHVALTGFDLGIRCLTWSSLLLWLMGRPDQALARIDQALARAAGLPHPFSRAYAYCLAAWLHQYRRDPQRVKECADIAITISTEHSFALWVSVALMLRGWAFVQEGRTDDGIDGLRRGMDVFTTTGAGLNRPHFLSMLAEAYGSDGRPHDGLRVLDEALALAEQSQDRCYLAELFRLKGEFELAAATPDAETRAEACFEKAVKIAHTQGAKLLELRALVSSSRLRRRQNRFDDARAKLVLAYGAFEEGFESVDLKEARALAIDQLP